MKNQIKSAVLTLAAGSMLFSAGCATKNYVRKEMTPTVNKVNELDEITAQNNRNIHDVDDRAQKGISGVNDKAAAADQKALAAGQRASDAQQLANAAVGRAEQLNTTVANLDNYKDVAEASVHFGFDKAELTKQAKAALDQLAENVPNTKGYIVELIGGTDSVGNPQYNYELSQRRVAAVTQYLAASHNIPAHKIFVIGLGEDKSVAANNSSKGRAENRRVEVHLMSNVNGADASTPASATNAQPR
jgi:outer membrane protein OmpA-like peptidoglycan-associated protein